MVKQFVLHRPEELSDALTPLFNELQNECDKIDERLITVEYKKVQSELLSRIELIDEIRRYTVPNLPASMIFFCKQKMVVKENNAGWQDILNRLVKSLMSFSIKPEESLSRIRTLFEDIKKVLPLQESMLSLVMGNPCWAEDARMIFGNHPFYEAPRYHLIKDFLTKYIDQTLQPYTSIEVSFFLPKSIVRQQTIDSLKSNIQKLLNEDAGDYQGKSFCYRLAAQIYQAEKETIKDHQKGILAKLRITKSRLAETLHKNLEFLVMNQAITRQELEEIQQQSNVNKR